MANQVRIIYEKNQILGRGGFGLVYKGALFTEKENQHHHVHIAVKRIEIDRLPSQSQSEDRELINQLKLSQHPNIVQLLHWEDEADFRLYALELCIVSLDRVHKDPVKYRRLVPSQFEFMLQLSHGLEYIHSKNLIHRDIKPENVLITKSLEGKPLVKWGDFGLSKAMTREECSVSGHRGTEKYWAPEIWRIWNDHRLNSTDKKMMTVMSDIFSSGCVFFEFCTGGIHPFGDNGTQIKTNLSMEPSNPYNLKELKESYFAYEIIKKMLKIEPRDRPNSREIIQILLSIKNEKVKEFHHICSLENPTEEEIGKILKIVEEDSIGLANTVDDNGFSPLLMMCRYNQSESLMRCIEALLTTNRINDTNKIEVNHKNRDGWTALHFLCRYYKRDDLIDVAKLLIENGVDVTTKQSDGWNALHILCGYYRNDNLIDLINLMIENGVVGVHLATDGGHTASDLFDSFNTFYKHGNKSQVLERLKRA